MATHIWNRFQGLCGFLHVAHTSVLGRLLQQRNADAPSAATCQVRTSLPLLILWEISRARNDANFGEVVMNVRASVNRIKWWASQAIPNFETDSQAPQETGYRVDSNNLAELRAIYDGMLLSLTKRMSQTIVESDSKLVVDTLMGATTCPWRWRPWVNRITLLRRLGIFQFNHTLSEELLEMGTKPNTFSYSELRTATGDFSLENKLGMGGFGVVYKRKTKPQLRAEEIVTISAVQHRNLVKLYGCCIDGDKRLLVYEYLENGSLDHALFGDSKLHLNWPTRYRICMGTTQGLTYLHEESSLRIVHRDIKASNILLDVDLNPKISDFGLAKLYDAKKTHISTWVAGTFGFLAPEYALRGHLTEKADVFGFGVVALEILSGRPNTDTSLDQYKYLLDGYDILITL
ncbi:probable LRR receptor-like serine/threonine-protein kinase At1g56140 [Magnolia sinica]|uniref:probable LRR receptor-like serine/threonine-protein kinase At1g56140 n=1 Tax=Magnolia sinica TaxID=86752 RepID=UPI002658B46D|nr:probable LRR receptor-like serine/threonine-protein kinase At1g56140 [Magnolia sinica]